MAKTANGMTHRAEIEQIVRRGANSLGEAVRGFWPGTTENHEIAERNITLYLGKSFADAGFQVFAETPYPNEAQDERLDLLALDPFRGIQVAIEAKRLFSGSQVTTLEKDLDRLRRFAVKTEESRIWTGGFRQFAAVACITWREDIAEWWSAKDGTAPHDGGSWNAVHDHPLLKDATIGCCVLDAYDEEIELAQTKFHYFLYGVTEIQCGSGGD